MKVFDIDFIDELSESQVRYLLRAELERNKLLVHNNQFLLFRYEVANDFMVILGELSDGSLIHQGYEHYTVSKSPIKLFDEAEHKKIITSLKNICDNPEYPKRGTEQFNMINGVTVSCEYSCLFDAEGNIETVVGEHVNIYQTHERMLSTIKMLNEQVAMTDIIRQSYETMVLCNLKDYSFEVIQGTPEVRFTAKKCNTVLDLAKLFCQYYIESDYQHGFMEFVDNISINDRLTENRFLVFEYQTHNIGWCRARIVPGEIDSRGNVISAIFTTERSVSHLEELSVLRVAATTDALTGLMNRYSGEMAIREKLEKMESGVYLLFDCDHFKTFNDKLGHPVGDKVLIEVAHALKDTFQTETVIRLGGDEFVVFISSRHLIGQTIFEGIDSVIAPLRQRLSQINIPALKGRTPTLSCGAVLISQGKAHTLDEIYQLADQKLYEAKTTHDGRYVCVEI